MESKQETLDRCVKEAIKLAGRHMAKNKKELTADSWRLALILLQEELWDMRQTIRN